MSKLFAEAQYPEDGLWFELGPWLLSEIYEVETVSKEHWTSVCLAWLEEKRVGI